ncbi:MAG: nickel-responsive transcriptional regulator NikR [Alphaproteobacteria bacterium]|nr:nickel-responsive transcriptional regulator NikR [Alphaproteobacteria bacterium]MDE2110505.1 nickel-responsive transcriptional regulator NikR [Alphaproteobacteria bacterium]MDE2493255.1 nickel-responsive transcriptional regulator NikR [Alphaproteobacteria bacterium]
MQRITIAVDDKLADEIDRLAKKRGYQNRSEAIRDLARSGLRQAAEEDSARPGGCVAALVYVYEHEARDLSHRLTKIFHEHHHLSVSAMHVHLDHGDCLELNVLQGAVRDVRDLAEHVIAERGVRHGRLVTFPTDIERGHHGRDGSRPHRHRHTRRPKDG